MVTRALCSDEPRADNAGLSGLIVYDVVVEIVSPAEPAFVHRRRHPIRGLEAELVQGRRSDAAASLVGSSVRYAVDPEGLVEEIPDLDLHSVPQLAPGCTREHREQNDDRRRDYEVARGGKGAHPAANVFPSSLEIGVLKK